MKNEGSGASCFVCGKVLPGASAGSPAAAAAAPVASAGSRRKAAAPSVLPGAVGDRGVAVLFDRLFLVAIVTLVLGFFYRQSEVVRPSLSTLQGVGLASGWFVLVFVYHTLLEGFAGTTPGKLVMGLRVVGTGDRKLIAAVALRNLLRLVDGLIFYLPGFLVALHNRNHRRIGDYVGQTMVIQAPIQPLERAAALVTLVAIVAGAIWGATAFCPGCGDLANREIAGVLHALATHP